MHSVQYAQLSGDAHRLDCAASRVITMKPKTFYLLAITLAAVSVVICISLELVAGECPIRNVSTFVVQPQIVYATKTVKRTLSSLHMYHPIRVLKRP